MRVKYQPIKFRFRRDWLVIVVEVNYGTTIRWVDLKVPWRMLNEHYEYVAGGMADEAHREMLSRQVVEQDPLPGIG